MKIGVISDTHDRLEAAAEALTLFERSGVTLVIHCGDWAKPESASHLRQQAAALNLTVLGVLGNNDKAVDGFLALITPEFQLKEGVLETEQDGKRIAAYHGHHTPTLRRLLAGNHDVLLLGHSHKPRYDMMPPKIILNPGSTAFSIPRSRTWRASIAIYDSVEHQAEFVYFTVS